MADAVIAGDVYKDEITYSRQAQMPIFYNGSYDNDADYHIMRVRSSGKGRFSYSVNNEANQDVVISLYAGFSADGDVGDDDVFAIDSVGITATASGGKVYETCSDPFPYFYIRTKAAAAGDAGEVNVYAAFMAF